MSADARIRNDLWREYNTVCKEAEANGRYERVEPLAWRRLQQELRKLKAKAA